MAETFQTIATSAAALAKLLEWSDRFYHAEQTVQRASAKADDIVLLISQITRILDQRTPLPEGHLFKSADEKALENLVQQAIRCNDHIQDATAAIFGKNAVNWARKTVRKVRIASKPGRIQELNDQLSHDLQMLSLYFSYTLLQMQTSSVAHAGSTALQYSMGGYSHKSFIEMMRYQDLFRTHAKYERIEPAPERPASVAPSERLRSRGVEGHSPDTAQREVDKQNHPVTSQTSLQDEYAAQAPSYPVEVLDDMIASFKDKAAKAQNQGEWLSAKSNLEALLDAQRQKSSKTGDAFADQWVLERMLINVLLQVRDLRRWDQALQRIEAFEQQTNAASQQHGEAPGGNLDEARRHQLKALVLLDRHSKSASREYGLANGDVETAKELAHKAYEVHHEEVKQSTGDGTVSEYEMSVELLVTSLRILGGSSETIADSVLKTAEEICGHPIKLTMGFENSPVFRADLDTFEFEESEEEADRDESATPVSAARSSTTTHTIVPHSNEVQPDATPTSPRRSASGGPNLIEATIQGHNDDIRRYLESHPDAAIDQQDEDGWTPLHHAADLGNIELIELFIPHAKTDVLAATKGEETALLIALKRGEPATTKALAGHSLFGNTKFDNDETVLHRAVYRDNVQALEALLSTECGRKLVAVPDVAGVTPLHLCCSRESFEQVGQILKHCANDVIDMRTRGKDGDTALDLALASTSPEASQIVDMIREKRPQAKYSDSSKKAFERHIASCKRKDEVRAKTEEISIKPVKVH